MNNQEIALVCLEIAHRNVDAYTVANAIKRLFEITDEQESEIFQHIKEGEKPMWGNAWREENSLNKDIANLELLLKERNEVVA